MRWLAAFTLSIVALAQDTRDLENQYRRVLKDLESSQSSVALSNALNELAALYFDQHAYDRAERLIRSALTVEQSLAAPRELEIARRLNNVAAACLAQGKTKGVAGLIR